MVGKLRLHMYFGALLPEEAVVMSLLSAMLELEERA
jgi:hypothetical protein